MLAINTRSKIQIHNNAINSFAQGVGVLDQKGIFTLAVGLCGVKSKVEPYCLLHMQPGYITEINNKGLNGLEIFAELNTVFKHKGVKPINRLTLNTSTTAKYDHLSFCSASRSQERQLSVSSESLLLVYTGLRTLTSHMCYHMQRHAPPYPEIPAVFFTPVGFTEREKGRFYGPLGLFLQSFFYVSKLKCLETKGSYVLLGIIKVYFKP